MKITFLLPTPGDVPVGGYKVVYKYANELVNSGHNVSVVHRMSIVPEKSQLRQYARYCKLLAKGSWKPTKWFQLDPRVRLRLAIDFSEATIGSNDVLVSTSWITAEYSANLPSRCGRKYYFVQDYEHYMSGDAQTRERISKTFQLGFKTVVISPSCRQLVEDCGGVVHAEVPNGLDHNIYRTSTPINSPERNGIGFPYREESFKRSPDAVKALSIVRDRFPTRNFRYWTFGGKRPSDLPEWIEFHVRPTDAELVDLYNKSAVFVVPSHYEGWGLPGSEAMCCGAALASTDSGGVRAYARHEVNALISEPLNVSALAENISALLVDSTLLKRIASTGHSDIQQFTWSHGASKLEQALINSVDRHV